MARVRLHRGEVRQGGLPPVCMRCGADAELERKRQFSWNPSWVYLLILLGLLPFVIVALVLTKRMTVHAPLCRDHKNHWLTRNLIIYLGLLPVALLGFGAILT